MSNINTIMEGGDTISGSLAECYYTLNGRRYNGMQFVSVEAKVTKTKKEVPILGKTGKANKGTGWKGTGSGKMHYCSAEFRMAMLDYVKNGKDFYFDMQISNEDPTSKAGRQTVILKNCNMDSLILAKFDADSDIIDEDFDFTFDDVEIPEVFKELAGM